MIRQEPLLAFARGFHQDVMIGVIGLDALAAILLEGLSAAEKQAFRDWLSQALATLTPSEMKGMLNRANVSIGFSSKGAYALLRAAADQLGLP
jgi:hypothetical protein